MVCLIVLHLLQYLRFESDMVINYRQFESETNTLWGGLKNYLVPAASYFWSNVIFQIGLELKDQKDYIVVIIQHLKNN